MAHATRGRPIMEVCITKAELEKALQELNKAIENGFVDSIAILQLYQGGTSVSDCMVQANGVILKAHPSDGSKNWGRTNPEWYKYIDGKCVEVDN